MLSFYLIWSPDPSVFPGLDIPRWYGVLFALGFILSQQVMFWIYRKEGKDEKAVDKLTIYMVVATVIGARLGHCLFYDPVYYLSNPLEILKIWQGGLASHGGALGIFVALWLFARNQKIHYYWILDRVAIVVCLTGACIRMGNFMNSEILGKPTESSYGVVFPKSVEALLMYRNTDRIEDITFEKGGNKEASPGLVPMKIILTYKRGMEMDEVRTYDFFQSNVKNALINYREASEHIYEDPDEPLDVNFFKVDGKYIAEISTLGIARHPAQLYESIFCVLLMLLTGHLWYHHRHQLNEGIIFGVFMLGLWSFRFAVEFLKENQEAWEADIPLNMGQWLSIPMAIAAIVIIVVQATKKKETAA